MKKNTDSLKEWLTRLPKIDLHCHLDGSIPEATLRRLCRRHGIEIPAEKQEFLQMIQVQENCKSLKQYLDAFELPLCCLQKEEDFFEAAREIVSAASKERVRYLELRFAPLLSESTVLSAELMIEAVLAGIRTAEKEYPISGNLILCAMRHFSEEQNFRTLKLAKKYQEKGVCALDLAGDESAYPNELFADLFQQARKEDLRFTIHSGECGRVQNIRLAAEWGAERIGHGIAMQGNVQFQSWIAEKGVTIELCPKSNLQTGAVKDIYSYPLKEFMENGIKVSVNTDNRTVTGTSVSQELLLLNRHFGLTEQTAKYLMRQSAASSFAEEAVKKMLMQELS